MKVKYLIIVFLFNSCLSLKFGNKEVRNSTFENQETIEFINSQENIDRGYPFSEATVVNGIIYLSGEIGTLPDGSLIAGDFNEIIAKDVAIATFILRSERITSIGIIINPPPAPINPVKKPISDPSANINNLFGAIVFVCFNPTIVFGVRLIIRNPATSINKENNNIIN